MKRDLSWLKDWRFAGGAGLVAGFFLGLLIFCAPWHLPPDWGDVPTWLLVVLGVVAGWIGLSQFRILIRQNSEEVQRNIKRDQLLNRQLAEAESRAVFERRYQAEGIEVSWGGMETGVVTNNSRRPISAVSCKIMSVSAGGVLADECGLLTSTSGIRGRAMDFLTDVMPGGLWERLKPDGRCSFTFKGRGREKDQVLVAWFTDDAGFRWQLDEYLHLVQASDGDEFVP